MLIPPCLLMNVVEISVQWWRGDTLPFSLMHSHPVCLGVGFVSFELQPSRSWVFVQSSLSGIFHSTAMQAINNSIFSYGVNLAFLYPPQLCNKIVFLVSFVGNRGTFTRGYRAVVMDMAFLYHVAYVLVCMLGLCVHEFFYSFLVSVCFCGGENFAKIENTVARMQLSSISSWQSSQIVYF